MELFETYAASKYERGERLEQPLSSISWAVWKVMQKTKRMTAQAKT